MMAASAPSGRARHLASKFVAASASTTATSLLTGWRALPGGADAAVIGRIDPEPRHGVVLETDLGGERILEELEDDPLPRIC